MTYEEFIETVRRESGAPPEEAERAVRATLTVLGERLSLGEAEDLAELLPPQLGDHLRDGKLAQGFDVQEFIHRVALREGVEDAVAEAHARAVFAALGRVLTQQEMSDMMAQLSADYGLLLAATGSERREPLMSVDEFLQKVLERSPATDLESARKATEAVLEVLGYRIAGGEVEDLEQYLPADLHGPLERGRRQSENAQPLSLDEFLQRVADLEGVDLQRARDDTRAELTTLRDVVPEKEFEDVMAELPKEFRELVAA